MTTVDFVLFIKWQFSITTQNVLHLNQGTQGHVWAGHVTRLQKYRGGCEWFGRHQRGLLNCPFIFKCSWKLWRFFFFGSIPKDKNLKDGGPHFVTLNLDNFSKNILIRIFFFLFAWGIHSWNMSKRFRYTLWMFVRKLSIHYDTFLHIALFPSGCSICAWKKWLCKLNTKTRFLFLSFFFLPISDLEIERIVSQVQCHRIHSSKIFLIYSLRNFLWIIHKLTELLSDKCGYFNQSHFAVQPNNSNWLLFMGSEVLCLPYRGVFWHRVLWE